MSWLSSFVSYFLSNLFVADGPYSLKTSDGEAVNVFSQAFHVSRQILFAWIKLGNKKFILRLKKLLPNNGFDA